MNEQDFTQRLTELIAQIGDLPEPARSRLEKLAGETKQRHERMRKTMSDLQESLDYLRLSIKYLLFDLEATRRENQYLRTLLDRQSRSAGGSVEDGA
jgi:chromosome segregation ATPase